MTIHNNALYAEVANRVRHQIQVGLESSSAWYPAVATVVNSDTDYEEYDWLGAFPEVYEWLGDMIFDQLSSAEFLIRNKDWANGIKLPKKKIDDGKTGYFGRLAEGLSEMFNRHPDKLLMDLISAGETTECFDGQNFFDTDHVWGDSGTQSNLLTEDVADPAAPTGDELRTAVENVLVNMLSYKNDRGEPFVYPTVHDFSDLTILCTPALWPRLEEAFKASWKVDSGAAVPNFLITRPTIVPHAGYTGNQMDVFRTGQAIKPFVLQKRSPVELWTKDHDDPEAKDVKVGGTARYNVGPLAWWLANRVKFT